MSSSSLDYRPDDSTFQWSTQNQTKPTDKWGREIMRLREEGIAIHLFVRNEKLAGGKSAPFVYRRQVEYVSHGGQAPMRVVFRRMPPPRIAGTAMSGSKGQRFLCVRRARKDGEAQTPIHANRKPVLRVNPSQGPSA